jgi:Tol biopolymer transport system component
MSRHQNGVGDEELLGAQGTNVAPTSWSRDGRFILFATGFSGNLQVISPSERKASVFQQTPFNETAAQFSPDGRWVAYQSNESGRYEVYVTPFSGCWRQMADQHGRRHVSTMAA